LLGRDSAIDFTDTSHVKRLSGEHSSEFAEPLKQVQLLGFDGRFLARHLPAGVALPARRLAVHRHVLRFDVQVPPVFADHDLDLSARVNRSKLGNRVRFRFWFASNVESCLPVQDVDMEFSPFLFEQLRSDFIKSDHLFLPACIEVVKFDRLLTRIKQNRKLDVPIPVGDSDGEPAGEHVLHHAVGDYHGILGRKVVLIHVCSRDAKVGARRNAECIQRRSSPLDDFDSWHVDGLSWDEEESELGEEVEGRNFLQVFAVFRSPISGAIAVEVRQPAIILRQRQRGRRNGEHEQTDGDEKVYG